MLISTWRSYVSGTKVASTDHLESLTDPRKDESFLE